MVAFVEVTEQLQRLELFSRPSANANGSHSMPEASCLEEHTSSNLSSSASATCYMQTDVNEWTNGEESVAVEPGFRLGRSFEKDVKRQQSLSWGSLRLTRSSYRQWSPVKYRRKKQQTSAFSASEAWSADTVCWTPELICFGEWTAKCKELDVHSGCASVCDRTARPCLVCQKRPKSQPCLLPYQHSLGKRCHDESPRPNINFAKMTKSSSLRSLDDCAPYVLLPADTLSPIIGPAPVQFANPVTSVEAQAPTDLDLDAIERD